MTIQTFKEQLASSICVTLPETISESESLSDFMQISKFSHVFGSNIKALSNEEISSVFEIIENAIVHGEEDTKNAATTVFLENLQNSSLRGVFSFKCILPLLGKESKCFCKAVDKFYGNETPGLWDDKCNNRPIA